MTTSGADDLAGIGGRPTPTALCSMVNSTIAAPLRVGATSPARAPRSARRCRRGCGDTRPGRRATWPALRRGSCRSSSLLRGNAAAAVPPRGGSALMLANRLSGEIMFPPLGRFLPEFCETRAQLAQPGRNHPIGPGSATVGLQIRVGPADSANCDRSRSKLARIRTNLAQHRPIWGEIAADSAEFEFDRRRAGFNRIWPMWEEFGPHLFH